MTDHAQTYRNAFIGLDQSAMERLAAYVALALKPGDTVTLVGDLGAGKTTFARAFIRAFMAEPALEVVSPTFSLVQTYDGARGRIEHYDLYRLTGAEQAVEIGLDDAAGDAIRLIEWPERLADALPVRRLEIVIEDDSEAGAHRTVGCDARGEVAARVHRIMAAEVFVGKAGWADAGVAYLQGDASTRRYARLTRDDGTSAVLMDSPRQPDGPIIQDGKPYSRLAHLAEDVRPFVAVDHALRSAGLSAPAIIAQDLDDGFLLLEDLGDRVFGREADGGARQAELWTAALDMLVAFRKCGLPMEMAVVPGDAAAGRHALPLLDKTILGIELALLPEWFWRENHGAPMPPDLRAEYDALWRPIVDMLLAAPKGWILRDVHSPNLLWLPRRTGIARVGVIDFQDAIAGPWAHDVMSLLQDARIDVSADLETELLRRYADGMRGHPGFDEAEFRFSYAAYGALRATRLLGLFVRLLRRDHKPHYVAHIPRNWGYLVRNLAHPMLKDLRAWYDQHLPQEVRDRAIVP